MGRAQGGEGMGGGRASALNVFNSDGSLGD